MTHLFRLTVLVCLVLAIPADLAAVGELDNTQNLAILIDRLETLNDTGELDRLIAEGQRDVEGDQVSADKCFELGLLLVGKALFSQSLQNSRIHWRSAMRCFEKALSLSPRFAEAHALLGHLHMSTMAGERYALDKARSHFQEALKLKPGLAAAREGIRYLALSTADIGEKLKVIQKNLTALTRVTRSGRQFSVLAVRLQDSLKGNDLLTEIKVSDLPGSAIADTLKVMQHLGGVTALQGHPATPKPTISSLIRMIGEINGLIYANITNLQLEFDRMATVLQGREMGTTFTVCIPLEVQIEYTGKQIDTRTFFGKLIYKTE